MAGANGMPEAGRNEPVTVTPAERQLGNEDPRHQRRAEEQAEQEVEPPSAAEMKTEVLERAPVEPSPHPDAEERSQ